MKNCAHGNGNQGVRARTASQCERVITIPEERALATFVNHQRTAYWADPQQYPEPKKSLLNEFPGVWQENAKETQWRATANKLKQWKAHARNPCMDPKQQSTDPEEAALGVWIMHQRLRKKENKLEAWQIQELEAIVGWEWDSTKATWFRNCAEAIDFKDAHAGQLPNRRATNPYERKLGEWIHNQKKNRRFYAAAEKRMEAIGCIGQ